MPFLTPNQVSLSAIYLAYIGGNNYDIITDPEVERLSFIPSLLRHVCAVKHDVSDVWKIPD